MIGLPKGTVKLESHSEQWLQLFAKEAARIREAIGEVIASIEHIGSTSIGGLRRNRLLILPSAWRNSRTAKDVSDHLKISVTNTGANTELRGDFISTKASRARIMEKLHLLKMF